MIGIVNVQTFWTHFFDRSNVEVKSLLKFLFCIYFADKITCTSMWFSMFAGGSNLKAKLLSSAEIFTEKGTHLLNICTLKANKLSQVPRLEELRILHD